VCLSHRPDRPFEHDQRGSITATRDKARRRTSSILLCLTLVILLSQCVTNGHFNRLRVGMTKQQVLATVGEPDETSRFLNNESWHYKYLQPFEGPQSRQLKFGPQGTLVGWR
jgi:hypothetical protein